MSFVWNFNVRVRNVDIVRIHTEDDLNCLGEDRAEPEKKKRTWKDSIRKEEGIKSWKENWEEMSSYLRNIN